VAYSFTRLGHGGIYLWERWNTITDVVGPVWYLAHITGATSGATGYVMTFGQSFNGTPNSTRILRLNGTAFTGLETVNITGGGSFKLAAAVTSTSTHPVMIVNGADTANLFNALVQQSISAGWGYHDITSATRPILNCSIIVGTPDQTAVTTAVSQMESIKYYSLWVGGNATYPSTLTLGAGTLGSAPTSRLGSVIESIAGAPSYSNGSTRYGYMEAHASTISAVEAAWKVACQRVESWDSLLNSALGLGLSGNALWGSAVTDVATVNSCSVYASIGASHLYPSFNDVKIDAAGSGSGIGIFTSGGGDFTATDISIVNATNSIFGFVSGGTKTFKNCYMDPSTVSSFFSGLITLHQWTVDVNCKNTAGTNISGVRVRAWDVTQNPLVSAPLWDVTTGAGGSIAQQVFTFYVTDSSLPNVDYNPITLWVTKTGWREVKIVKTLAAPLALTLALEEIKTDPLRG